MSTSQRTSGASIRAVIHRILADIPQINYADKVEAVAKRVALEALPDKIKAALHGDAERYIHYESWRPIYKGRGGYNFSSIYLPLPRTSGETRDALMKKLNRAVEDLVDAANKQQAEIETLRNELNATLHQFSTWGAARKACPELAKYMPQPNAPIVHPVAIPGSVENAMAALMKAGWPKEKVAA